ncbi:conserved hypothetical protein [Ricinus communis]|uniref:Uncharacterized protein n=1 Tax=Ricinus communis TaxID=3988 RepID=B9RC44_RICCO|nr:conserved hypothetical protein [Ricinus communis]
MQLEATAIGVLCWKRQAESGEDGMIQLTMRRRYDETLVNQQTTAQNNVGVGDKN